MKKLSHVTAAIQARMEELKKASNTPSSASDPEDKGTPSEKEHTRDKAHLKEQVPGGYLDNTNKKLPKTVDRENTHDSDDASGKALAQPATTIQEPEKSARSIVKSITSQLAELQKTANKGAKEKAGKTEDKKASEASGKLSDVQFGPDYFLKLAQTINANEERRNIVEAWAEEDYGAEVAEDLVKFASYADSELPNALAELQYEEDVLQAYQAELSEKFASLPKEEVEKLENFQKLAAILTRDMDEDEKYAFMAGADTAAEMEDGGGELGMPGEEPSLEEILMLVEQLVAQGEISPEEGEEIIAELLASEEEAAMEAAPEEMKAASKKILKFAESVSK